MHFDEDQAAITDAIVALTLGRYGDAETIDSNSRGWYEHYDAPMRLYDSGTLHPGAESILEARALESTAVSWEADDVFQPLVVHSGDARSITSTDHPADREVDIEVSSRTEESIVPLSPTTEVGIAAAFGDLLDYGGQMGRDAITYLKRLRLVENTTVVGGTWTDLVGLSYFDVSTFDNAEEGSESLLHECLHSKAQRITRGFNRPFLDDHAPETLEIPWWRTNKSKTFWNVSRSFDAFHVYSHISLLAAARYLRTGSTRTLQRCQVAAFRSAYLHTVLEHAAPTEIDDERRDMVAWIHSNTMRPFGLSETASKLIESPLGVN